MPHPLVSYDVGQVQIVLHDMNTSWRDNKLILPHSCPPFRGALCYIDSISFLPSTLRLYAFWTASLSVILWQPQVETGKV